MADNTKIDLDELKVIANSMKEENDKIEELYQKNIKYILNNSYEVITKQGINYDEYCESFENLFHLLEDNISNLSEVLSNKIVPGYENISQDIVYLFNNQFAETMKLLLEEE